MDVYIYESPNGLVADFRPYLDGHDHSFEPPRQMGGQDARWEKIQNILCPRSGESYFGKLKCVGRGDVPDYHELMIFPIAFEGDFERSDAAEDESAAESPDGAEAEQEAAADAS